MQLTHGDYVTMLVGALSAMACALPGNFLMLRRLSMMGDAISHAVLPGLVIAFMISNSRAGMAMFLGAAIVGVATAVFTQAIHSLGKVEQSAAMGVVFTGLFAFGLVLISSKVTHVDLDPGCVLYGSLEMAALNVSRVGPFYLSSAVLGTGAFLLALVVVLEVQQKRRAQGRPSYVGWTMLVAVLAVVGMFAVGIFGSLGQVVSGRVYPTTAVLSAGAFLPIATLFLGILQKWRDPDGSPVGWVLLYAVIIGGGMFAASTLGPVGQVFARSGAWYVPTGILVNGFALIFNLVVILLLYKEFTITAFDPALATTQGINANLMHYLLMILVAMTTVAAFNSVGSILVIAMLIVPAATAHMLTDRLPWMLVISSIVAAISGVVGHLAAKVVPGWFGFPGMDTKSSGMITVVAGLMLALAVLLSPRHGLVSRFIRQLRLGLRIAREDILGMLYRAEEQLAAANAAPSRHVPAGPSPSRAMDLPSLAAACTDPVWQLRLALMDLRRKGLVHSVTRGWQLSDAGRTRARKLIRSHRLWEMYGQQFLSKPLDHLHYAAESFEHITDEDLQKRLADRVQADTQGAAQDPHGHKVPSDADDSSTAKSE